MTETMEVLDLEESVQPDDLLKEFEREHYEDILRLNRDVKLAPMKNDNAPSVADISRNWVRGSSMSGTCQAQPRSASP